ncbi:uncharacterized protein MKK02DRAFT_37583 [Dioszegia hungarica]|uniref:Uncharacterized protein n=1 Tax=Dioszegia hungarica TaxID=4972 RepID=A0AA38H970_9TREE|nr:uncharacterized protein MKK02DRAFT_37583 [Dioszegia hungarica]KAI9634704.1 hypothetical protein MKK02DRAFT_37583 [Dioszegia hungarica]
MTPTLTSRLSRFPPALTIAIIATALFATYYLAPSTPYHFSTSSWSVTPPTLPSAWLSDDGHLDFRLGGAFRSRYTLLQEYSGGYSCDEEEILADGQRVCHNTVSVLRSLWSNVRAQQRYLADEKVREDARIAGKEEGVVAPLDHLDATNRLQAEEFSETFQNISSIVGKRILVIGDSLDRNWITELVGITAPSSHHRNHDLSSYVPADAAPLAPRSSPSNSTDLGTVQALDKRRTGFFECSTAVVPIASSPSLSSDRVAIGDTFIPPFNRDLPGADQQFRIDFVFAFGVLNEGAKPSMPGNTSHRVEALRQVVGGGKRNHDSRPYDAITVNFGLWDLVGFQRRAYLATAADKEPGLTFEWIAEYTQTCQRFIQSLRDTYGSHTPIYFRLAHVTGPGLIGRDLLGLPPKLHALAEAEMVPTFKPLRVAQLRRAQIDLAKSMGVTTINFARRFEGYGTEMARDGTHPKPEADQVYAELLLRQLMTH